MNGLPVGRGIMAGERYDQRDVAAVWAERRRAIIESYRHTKNLTLTALAFGISFQRVAQIVKRYGAGS